MLFPTKITSSCIWVATPVDWVILHWYVCGADGRLLGQFSRMGRFTSFSYPWCSAGALRRESSAIIWENLIRIKAFCIWLSLKNYFTGELSNANFYQFFEWRKSWNYNHNISYVDCYFNSIRVQKMARVNSKYLLIVSYPLAWSNKCHFVFHYWCWYLYMKNPD